MTVILNKITEIVREARAVAPRRDNVIRLLQSLDDPGVTEPWERVEAVADAILAMDSADRALGRIEHVISCEMAGVTWAPPEHDFSDAIETAGDCAIEESFELQGVETRYGDVIVTLLHDKLAPRRFRRKAGRVYRIA